MERASKKNNYHYNKALKQLARNNRKSMPKSATCMWKYVLSNKQFMGYSFRRERPILNYIADFVCFELMLVIEIDGLSHESEIAVKKDKIRDSKLYEIGFTVKRYGSWEVLYRMVDVVLDLGNWVIQNAQVESKII